MPETMAVKEKYRLEELYRQWGPASSAIGNLLNR